MLAANKGREVDYFFFLWLHNKSLPNNPVMLLVSSFTDDHFQLARQVGSLWVMAKLFSLLSMQMRIYLCYRPSHWREGGKNNSVPQSCLMLFQLWSFLKKMPWFRYKFEVFCSQRRKWTASMTKGGFYHHKTTQVSKTSSQIMWILSHKTIKLQSPLNECSHRGLSLLSLEMEVGSGALIMIPLYEKATNVI